MIYENECLIDILCVHAHLNNLIINLLGSGAAALAHLDGAGTEDAAAAMIQRVTELAIGFPEGRLELQLVGGYSDPRNYSEELFSNILCKYFLSLSPVRI